MPEGKKLFLGHPMLHNCCHRAIWNSLQVPGSCPRVEPLQHLQTSTFPTFLTPSLPRSSPGTWPACRTAVQSAGEYIVSLNPAGTVLHTPLSTANLTKFLFHQSGETRDENSVTDEINITWAVPKVISFIVELEAQSTQFRMTGASQSPATRSTCWTSRQTTGWKSPSLRCFQ